MGTGVSCKIYQQNPIFWDGNLVNLVNHWFSLSAMQPLRRPGPLSGQVVRTRRGFAARIHHHGSPRRSHSATRGPHDVWQGPGLLLLRQTGECGDRSRLLPSWIQNPEMLVVMIVTGKRCDVLYLWWTKDEKLRTNIRLIEIPVLGPQNLPFDGVRCGFGVSPMLGMPNLPFFSNVYPDGPGGQLGTFRSATHCCWLAKPYLGLGQVWRFHATIFCHFDHFGCQPSNLKVSNEVWNTSLWGPARVFFLDQIHCSKLTPSRPARALWSPPAPPESKLAPPPRRVRRGEGFQEIELFWKLTFHHQPVYSVFLKEYWLVGVHLAGQLWTLEFHGKSFVVLSMLQCCARARRARRRSPAAAAENAFGLLRGRELDSLSTN